MDEDVKEVLTNIRACIVSNKGPTPLRNLSRDYDVLAGSQIPYRRFNFSTLEEFLRSLPSLRVHGSGPQATVEAASSGASSHISALISKQKSSKKPVSLPPRGWGSAPSSRGRGGVRGRGRGRGNYASRPYAARDYGAREQSSWDYPAREQSSWDYRDRDAPSRENRDRDPPSRDYRDRDPPSRDYFARDQSKDYSEGAQSVPKRYSPNLHRQDGQPGGPLTVKVDAEDKRQVSWKKAELPPRLQRLRQQSSDPQQDADIPQASPPASPGAQGFDSSLFLNQTESNSASIISPFGPSKLIERAKNKARKSLPELQPQGLLLQPVTENNLAGNFSRLSHQITKALGNHLTSNGQNQNQSIEEELAEFRLKWIKELESPPVSRNSTDSDKEKVVEELSVPAETQQDDLPTPDHKVLQNNTAILLRYCVARGWPVPTYSVQHHKDPEKQVVLYFASVKVNMDDSKMFKFSTLPFEHQDVNLVKGFAAKKALEEIIAQESKKVKADKIISTNSNIICCRIINIVAGADNGLFAHLVEDKYIERHNELLPNDWLRIVESFPALSVESTLSGTIIVPRNVEARPNQFDPTVPPPPLSIETLGDAEDMEDVYITHATSVNNVWFRVIGTDYSDKYAVLLKDMDTYYKGLGAKDQALTVEVDGYYAAHDREFYTWFRVCVTEVDDASQTATAWLVDHGDYGHFPFRALYRLAPQFCQLPRQAVQCVLDDLESFNDDEMANDVVSNSDLLIGKSLIAKMSHKDTEAGFVKATMYDTSGPEDLIVNEQIKEEIIARAKPVLPAEGCAAEVAIGDVSNKGEVYIMFNGPPIDRIAETLESLGSEKILEHKLTSFKHISLNKMYLAKYSKDETWYRAMVVATPSVQHNKIPVRFVDYGNSESVGIADIADLENLPSLLRKLPAQAVKVALHNLPVESLRSHEIARLHSLLLDEDKVVLIKTVSLKADPPIVEIFTKEENGALVSINSTIELQRKLLSPSGLRNGEKKNTLNDANLNEVINAQDEFDLQCPDLSSDNYFEPVLVILAAHPGNFIFQPVKYAREMKMLKGQMAAYYDAGALPELPPDRISKNKLFASRYNQDNLWYRVLVTDAPIGSRVPVRLCDHGDVTCVSISSLRELAPEFHAIPFMAVKGRLAGVTPRHKDWTVEDCIRFKDLVVDHLLAGIIVDIEKNQENSMEMIVTLNLVDTNSDVDLDIADILVQEQRAVKEIAPKKNPVD